MFDDQELHETIQAFKEMGVPEIELQPTLDFLAATRARTVRDGSAVQGLQPTAPGPSLSLSNRLKVAA